MARARVQLRHATTYTGIFAKDKPWKRNEVRFIVNRTQIRYYAQQAEFVVTDAPEAPGAEGEQPAVEEPYRHTFASLNRFTKPELVEYAAITHGLELDADDRKDDLIAAILEAQG